MVGSGSRCLSSRCWEACSARGRGNPRLLGRQVTFLTLVHDWIVPAGLAELTGVAWGLSRHDLLQQRQNAPMLVINGADDYFVPQDDTMVFADRRDTKVQLLRDTGHCAVSKMPEVMALATEWLREQLVRDSR